MSETGQAGHTTFWNIKNHQFTLCKSFNPTVFKHISLMAKAGIRVTVRIGDNLKLLAVRT